MLDIKFIRKNQEEVRRNMIHRGYNPKILDKLLLADEIRSQNISELEEMRSQINQASKKNSQPDSEIIEKLKRLKLTIKDREADLEKNQKNFLELMLKIPNITLPEVPRGGKENNKIVRESGTKPAIGGDYLKIAEKLDLLDLERAGKISGSGFAFLKNQLVILEFALIQFAFQELIKKGFTPILPPILIKKEALQGAGFPWEEVYKLEKEDLYLIGTSEQAMLAMHKDEIIPEKELPKRYVAFSPCFRKEAGSYGQDVKGIFRMHQFDKIEMFSFCHPRDSQKEHARLVSLEEDLMQQIGLPYRLVHLASADSGISSASTFDIETWFPSQNQYRETHSCSNCLDFQSRRLNIRYRPQEFLHTLNGTVFSQRPLIAILENFIQKDGSIKIPKVLQKYTAGEKI